MDRGAEFASILAGNWAVVTVMAFG